MENSETALYLRAKRRVKDLKGFYWHLLAYFIVIPLIIFVNYRTSWEFKWFWFSTIGWGIGVLSHAFSVFWINGILGSNWEAQKIKKFMKQDSFKTRQHGKL
ncbi:2TM domain-containing protein [Arenibacter sp. GZD96]|uniref:2TM domain-containing protein n=1 Tax=Aurantibrevibacter litoralis TaxID=3106030 RepID=UPI002AFED33A|nr:2TM domain-containing protein [Arenibacter sp. GZD-96]MEA1786132.1 2TM domain-containing protein [Arenibacter sp. GZD-96]